MKLFNMSLMAAILALTLVAVSAQCPYNGYSRDKCGANAYSSYNAYCSCQPGLCCSKAGYCGPSSSSTDSLDAYCGQGCQSTYGACSNVASPACPANLGVVPSYSTGSLAVEVAAGVSLAPSTVNKYCCPLGQPIVSWSLARTDNLTGYFASYSGVYVGKVQATCKDGTVLPAITYGQASNGICKTQNLNAQTTVGAIPAGGSYYIQNGGVLDNFLRVGGTGGTAGSFTCPGMSDGTLTNEAAIGYQASSSCYGITNFKVLCSAPPKST